jgi:zinc/manganese transport system substrate-binding protein
MKNLILILFTFTSLFGALRVQTTYTTTAEIVKRIGGEYVIVQTLASPHYDPHFIVPKPSLIAKLRRADILVMNGAGLELGWLPPLLKGAHNAKIRSGAKSFIDISQCIDLLDKPNSVSRAFGDVHAQGNPHYMLDPYNVAKVAKYIYEKLSIIDSKHQIYYKNNLEIFLKNWQKFEQNLDTKISQCKSKKVVQYHELFNYFLNRYHFVSYGNIEPLPGVSPSSKHTVELINTIKEDNVSMILQDVYHSQKTAKFISKKADTKLVILPHDVGSVDSANTLENFYNTIAQRLCQ